MVEEKLLTVREVSLILGVSEKEVVNLAESGKIAAYKIGGVYLRFKREHIEQFRKTSKITLPYKTGPSPNYTFKERISDFFYFNDFYLLSILLILLIVFIIFRGL